MLSVLLPEPSNEPTTFCTLILACPGSQVELSSEKRYHRVTFFTPLAPLEAVAVITREGADWL
jgi:hypothetical protein